MSDDRIDVPATFATLFARLVTEIAGPATAGDSAAIATASATAKEIAALRRGAVPLVWDNWELRVGSRVFGPTTPHILNFLARMSAHGVRALSFPPATSEGELTAAAAVFAGEPALGDGGAAASGRIAATAPSVRIVPVVIRRARAEEPAVVETTAPTAPVVQEASPAPGNASNPDIDVGGEFMKVVASETADQLVGRLIAATSSAELIRTMEAMATLTEQPRKRLADTTKILLALIDAEPRLGDEDAQRSFRFALNRIGRAQLFRAMANDLAKSPSAHADYMRIFRYFGDMAADQLIQELAHAGESRERRVLFDALIELRHGVAMLISLLGDPRWFVVRNATELLGEMRAAEAQHAVAWLLNHPDSRVRCSAIAALMRFDNADGRRAVRESLRDPVAEVRLRAVAALATSRDREIAAALIRALPAEQDESVQRALAAALAHLGTPEAIQRLEAAAEPEPGLFRKRNTPLQVAAIEALRNPTPASGLPVIPPSKW